MCNHGHGWGSMKNGVSIRPVEKLQEYKAARKAPQGPRKRLFTVPEAAFYLGRTVGGLREMLYAGKIDYVKDGRRYSLT